MASCYFGSEKELYFRCMAHYASVAAENIPAGKIASIFHLFYPAGISDDICDKLEDRSKVIEKFYSEIKCFNCCECSLANNCNYGMSHKIKMALKDRMATASLMDLNELKI